MQAPSTNALPRSPWLILSFLCIPVFIGSIDLTIISAILPEVMVSLGLPAETRLDDAFWTITGYLLAYTISMVFVGRLSDIVGRRWMYIFCLILFMFGSYWVVTAQGWPTEWYTRLLRELNPDTRPPAEEVRALHMIIVGRVIQALGAGAVAPITMAMVADLFPPAQRARPIAVVGAIDTIGWVLGHLYGGIMVKFLGDNAQQIVDLAASLGLSITPPDWRWLFWFNLVAGGFTLLAVLVTLRGIKQPRLKEPFDFLGTAFIVLALIGLNLGLGNASSEPPSSISDFQAVEPTSNPYALLLLALAGISFLLFLLVESRFKYPLFNLGLFRQRNVSAASLTNVGVGFCLTIGLVTMPILVNIRESQVDVAGIRNAALIAGLLLSGLTVPMALAALPGAWVSDRYGYRFTTMLGMGLALAGFLLMGLTWRSETSYWLMGFQMAITGVGLGLTISPIGAAVINAAQDSERGAASAMVLALRLVGMTLALASLSDWAINRVNRLVGERAATALNPDSLYLVTTVEVVRELFLLGAVISVVTLVVAWGMRGGQYSQVTSAD